MDLEFKWFTSADLLLQTLLLLLQDVGDVVPLRRVLGVPPLLLLQICYDLQPPPRGDTESGAPSACFAERSEAIAAGSGRRDYCAASKRQLTALMAVILSGGGSNNKGSSKWVSCSAAPDQKITVLKKSLK